MMSSRTLLKSLALLVFMVARTAAASESLPDPKDLAESVERTLAAIQDISITQETELARDLTTPTNAPEGPLVTIQHWANTRDEKEVFTETFACPVGTDMQNARLAQKRAYYGESFRALLYDEETGKPKRGTLLPMKPTPLNTSRGFYLPAWARADCGGQLTFTQCSGLSIEGKTLSEWVRDSRARTIGEQDFRGKRAIVVEVPMKVFAGCDSRKTVRRFYLSKKHNLALLSQEIYQNGKPIYYATAAELQEVIPGVWLPMGGSNCLVGRTSPSGFKVLDIQVNEGIPDEEFEVVFPDGLEVTDARSGKNREVIWDSKAATLALEAPADGLQHSGAFLGVCTTEVRPYADALWIVDGKGAYVRTLFAEGSAEIAGIKPGDVIRKVNGTPVQDCMDLVRQIGTLAPSTSVKLEVWRDGAAKQLDAVLTEARK